MNMFENAFGISPARYHFLHTEIKCKCVRKCWWSGGRYCLRLDGTYFHSGGPHPHYQDFITGGLSPRPSASGPPAMDFCTTIRTNLSKSIHLCTNSYTVATTLWRMRIIWLYQMSQHMHSTRLNAGDNFCHLNLRSRNTPQFKCLCNLNIIYRKTVYKKIYTV